MTDKQPTISYFDMVKEFMDAMGQQPIDLLNMDDRKRQEHFTFRQKLIKEEHGEMVDAFIELMNKTILPCANKDTYPDCADNEFKDFVGEYKRIYVQYLDAICDLVYVLLGQAHSVGADFDAAFRRVHEANMSKLGSDGQPIVADGSQIDPNTNKPYPIGKVLKPSGWQPPDLSEFTGVD